MKFTDFLQDVGRPVAYYPKMKKLTGSTTATILLCQFMYWRGKESGGDGWLYKTSEEIEEETGLTYNEQKTARKSLVDNGLIEEHYARLDHQLRFRINLDAINDKWGVSEPKNGECDDSTFGKSGLSQSLNESEITAENTLGDKSPKKTNELPMSIENQIAAGMKEITLPDQKQARMRDTAQLIGMGEKYGAADLALAFMRARDIIIPEGKIKGQRKAVREMLEMGVRPEHITEAVQQLLIKGMTVIDLFSVSKTAQDLANKKEIYTGDKKQHGL